MQNKKPFLIGITGGSASGKTYFLKKIRESFSEDQVCIVSQDEYYKDKMQQPVDEQGIENYDTPFSVDVDYFLSDLQKLKSGQGVEKMEYTFNNPNATPKKLFYNPAPIIIVEGIFVLYFEQIVKELDFKIFLDAKEFVRLKRRIVRDKDERGYDLDDVLYRYEYHVAPTYERYIEPLKQEADIIVPNNRHVNNALDLVKTFIQSKIND